MKSFMLSLAVATVVFFCGLGARGAENAPIMSPDVSANPLSGPRASPVTFDRNGVPNLDVEFRIDSYTIPPGFDRNLNAFGRYMKKHPSSTAEIIGHADGTGHEPQNGALAQKRAYAVLDYLVSNYGIDPSRIKAYGKPALTDRVSNLTAAARQYDRRVVGIITVTLPAAQ